MGYLIDTNVWSELQKGERVNAGVKRWYDALKPEDLYVSVLVVGESRGASSVSAAVTRSRPRGSNMDSRLSSWPWANVSCPSRPRSPSAGGTWGYLIRYP